MNSFTKPLAVAFLLTIFLTGCGGGKPAAYQGSKRPPPEVDVITASQGRVTLTRDLPGRLQAYRTAQVRARVEGVIEKRLFEEGSDVKAGESLYRIDARTYRAAAESAKADLLIAHQNVERYKLLLLHKAVSQQGFDLSVAKLKQAEAVSIRAAEDLENASVPATISGHIGRTLVTEGAFVGKTEPTLLATIEQLDPIYANFTQSGDELLRLKQAIKQGRLKRAASTQVELLLEDGRVYSHPGKIRFTDQSVDPATGAVSMRASFANPQHELLPGMFVRLRFPQAQADKVIRVPQRAVQSGVHGRFVMTVGVDNKVVLMPVQTGRMVGGDFIISKGLKGGEQVIINGLQKARPGSVVKAVPWKIPAAVKSTAVK